MTSPLIAFLEDVLDPAVLEYSPIATSLSQRRTMTDEKFPGSILNIQKTPTFWCGVVTRAGHVGERGCQIPRGETRTW